MKISIPLTNDFSLDAGEVSTDYDEQQGIQVNIISPPSIPMFDQLLDYLNQQIAPNSSVGIQVRYLGVGFTALCIRWGSYLASLLDPHALSVSIHLVPDKKSSSQNASVSRITDSEMKRLNIEISYNIARLGEIYNHNSSTFYDLLAKAYHFLPMPAKSTRPNRELERNLVATYLLNSVLGYAHRNPASVRELIQAQLLPSDFDLSSPRWEETDPKDASRIIGNFLTNFAWRNTLIEDYHAGRTDKTSPLLPHQRRFSARDTQTLLRSLCSNGAVVVRQIEQLFSSKPMTSHPLETYAMHYPLSAEALFNSQGMLFYSYPYNWTLADSNSPVHLFVR